MWKTREDGEPLIGDDGDGGRAEDDGESVGEVDGFGGPLENVGVVVVSLTEAEHIISRWHFPSLSTEYEGRTACHSVIHQSLFTYLCNMT